MDLESKSVRGFKFSAVSAGIKHPDAIRLDFGLIVADVPAIAAGITTTNQVFAAPVEITRNRLSRGLCQAVLVNSGNANAYTGREGIQDALDLTRSVADRIKIDPELVIPMSTGVIGNRLPLDRMNKRISELAQGLRYGSYMDVARAIMTTDTRPKTVCLDGQASAGSFRVVGMTKGSGMIAPHLATMLAIILTDIRVEVAFLRECLVSAADESFNCITVDGDTSTNDTVLVLSGGESNAIDLGSSFQDRAVFSALLHETCKDLARQIVRDGEGATKVVEIRICGASDSESAQKVGRVIAESPLVKSAFHGEDPNWGRIICSAGRAGVKFDPNRIDLFIGDVPVVRNGSIVEEDWEKAAHTVMTSSEFRVLLDLKVGNANAVILTTDLSEEYVTINADYRS